MKKFNPFLLVLAIIGSIFGVLVIFFFAFVLINPPTEEYKAKKKAERDSIQLAASKEDTITKAPPYVLSEQDYLTFFQSEWDSVHLQKIGRFPQYEDYVDALDKVLSDMRTIIQKDSSQYLKLEKLRLKFIDSPKMEKAMSGYLTFGQTDSEYAIVDACADYLREVAHDPGSIDIIDHQIKGQSKKGYIITVKFRGRNAFGAKVLNTETFTVAYSINTKMYQVVG